MKKIGEIFCLAKVNGIYGFVDYRFENGQYGFVYSIEKSGEWVGRLVDEFSADLNADERRRALESARKYYASEILSLSRRLAMKYESDKGLNLEDTLAEIVGCKNMLPES